MRRREVITTTDGKLRLKYINFGEKLKMINPDVIHRVGHRGHGGDGHEHEHVGVAEGDSHFHQAVTAWRELNCTQHFQQFLRHVSGKHDTFNKVVHYKNDLIDAVLEHLSIQDSLATEPLLHLLTMLARDLRQDFHAAYFPRVIQTLTRLLKNQRADPQVIEQVFHALGFIFKYLRVELTRDIVATFDMMTHLLSDRHSYCKWFAAPSLAYLMRKCTDVDLVVAHILQTLNDASMEYVEGVAVVFYECMKGTQQMFHTRTHTLFPLLVSQVNGGMAVQMLRKLLILMAVHGNLESVNQLLYMLAAMPMTAVVLDALLTLASVRKGTRVRMDIIAEIVLRVIRDENVADLTTMYALIGAVMGTDAGQQAVDVMFTKFPAVIDFVRVVLDIHPHHADVLLPRCLTMMNGTEDVRPLIEFLAQAYTVTECATHSMWTMSPQLVEQFESLLLGERTVDSVLTLLNIAPPVNGEKLLAPMMELQSQQDDGYKAVARRAQILKLCHQFARGGNAQISKIVGELLMKHPAHEIVIACVAKMQLALDLESYYPLLVKNLSSQSKSLRVNTLTVIACCEHLLWLELASDAKQSQQQPCNLFELMLSVERTPDAADTSRDKLVRIRKLQTLCVTSRRLPVFYWESLVHHCLGLLSVNFKPIWNDVTQLLWSFAGSHQDIMAMTWRLVWERVSAYENDKKLARVFYMDGLDEKEMFNFAATSDRLNSKEVRSQQFNDGEFCDATVAKIAVMRESLVDQSNEIHKYAVMAALYCAQDNLDMKFDRVNYFGLLMRGVKENAARIWKLSGNDIVELFVNVATGASSCTVVTQHKRMLAWGDVIAGGGGMHGVKLKLVTMLRAVTEDLLCRNDTGMQLVALKICANIYASVKQHMPLLEELVDETTFRDGLTKLTANGGDASLTAEQRSTLMPFILRILYAKMSAKNQSDVAKTKTRRAAIMTYLTGLDVTEMSLFVDILLAPYRDVTTGELACNTQIAFLHKLSVVIRQLSTCLLPFIGRLWSTLITIGGRASQEIAIGDATEHWREVRTLVANNVLDMFEIPLMDNLTAVHDEYVPQLFKSIISPRLNKFAQENIQSPSAMLQLFAGWSQQCHFIKYLSQIDERVLPQVFACMSATNVKPSVVQCILSIVESLLQQCQNSHVAELVHRHATAIIDNVDTSLHRKSADSTLVGGDLITRKQIWILSQMLQFCADADQQQRLIDLLLPFLNRPNKLVPESTKCDILDIYLLALPNLPVLKQDCFDLCTSNYYSSACQLLQTLEGRDARSRLVQLFQLFAKQKPELTRVAGLLVELNAYNPQRLDEADWNTRLDAFARINETILAELTHDEWHPVLHCFVHFVQNQEEDVLRRNAAFGLSQFIKLVAQDGSPAQLKDLFTHVVYASTKAGLKSRNAEVCAQFTQVLHSMIQHMPHNSQFSQLGNLLGNGDEEVNFFYNVFHVQMHRRSRALRRFVEIMKTSEMPPATLTQLFIPMFQQFIMNKDAGYDQQTIADAIVAIGAASAYIGWGSYLALLKQYFKTMQHKPETEKVMLRLVLSVLSNFQWNLTSCRVISSKTGVTLVDFGVDADAEMSKDEQLRQHTVLPALVNYILPQLYKFISDYKDGDSNLQMRVPAAIAYAHLLKKLPEPLMKMLLPKMLTKIAQLLRIKDQAIRDSVRDTMTKLALIFGAPYLSFTIKELKSALTKGYQLHVLGYSVHQILAALCPQFSQGEIDSSLYLLLPLLLTDVFGTVAAEKEVNELARQSKEVKNKRGFESFEIIASCCSFDGLRKILSYLKNLMQETSGNAFSRNMADVLTRVARGAIVNFALNPVPLMKLITELIEGTGFYFEQRTVHDGDDLDNFERNFTVQQSQRVDGLVMDEKTYLQENLHLYTEFAFVTLHGLVKSGKIMLRDNAQHVEMLEYVFPIVVDGINSNHARVSKYALKVASLMPKHDLPNSDATFQLCFDRCYKILNRYLTIQHELVQDCLRFMTVMIRDNDKVRPSDKQLKFIIELIMPSLGKADEQSTTFAILRAILSRQFVVDEIDTLMDEIAKMMVTHGAPHVRSVCRAMLLQFLLEYDIGPSKMRKFVDFLLQNLQYEHECGRLSVLEFIRNVVTRFSTDVLEAYSEVIFMSLVLVLNNDASRKSKEQASSIVKVMYCEMSDATCQRVTDTLFKWLSAGGQLLTTGLQVAGIAFESVADVGSGPKQAWFARNASQQLQSRLLSVLTSSLDSRDADSDAWMVSYYALCSISKVYTYQTTIIDALPLSLIQQCMLDQHAWVRTVATQILNKSLTEAHFSSQEDASKLIVTSCQQLKSYILDESLGTTIIKNLIMLGKSLYAPFIADIRDETEDVAPGTLKSLMWLFKKLSSYARLEANSKTVLLRSLIFKWFAAMCAWMPGDQLEHYTYFVLAPVYRVAIDTTTMIDGFDQLKQLCVDLMDMLERALGTTAYFRIRQQVEQDIGRARDERRRAVNLLAITDPVASAKRKHERNAMKVTGRKRKMQDCLEKHGKRTKKSRE